MTQSIEIIPAVDIIGGECVRLQQGDYGLKTTYPLSPQTMVEKYVKNGLTRIHAVDLDGAKAGKPVNFDTLKEMSGVNGTKIEWGGGIKHLNDVEKAFRMGATYVVVGSVAARQPEKFEDWLRRFGPERMVLGADVKDGKIAVGGWLSTEDVTIEELISRFIPHGLNQVIVTDVSKDGMLEGPNINLYLKLQEIFPTVEVTVSGGISHINDIIELKEKGLRKVIVGKAIYEGYVTLEQLHEISKS